MTRLSAVMRESKEIVQQHEFVDLKNCIQQHFHSVRLRTNGSKSTILTLFCEMKILSANLPSFWQTAHYNKSNFRASRGRVD